MTDLELLLIIYYYCIKIFIILVYLLLFNEAGEKNSQKRKEWLSYAASRQMLENCSLKDNTKAGKASQTQQIKDAELFRKEQSLRLKGREAVWDKQA